MFNRISSNFFNAQPNNQNQTDNTLELPSISKSLLLDKLPNELLTEIILKLDPASIAKGLALTNQKFHEIATSDLIFKKKLNQHFLIESNENIYDFFGDTYKNQYKFMSADKRSWHSLLKEGDIERIKKLELKIEDILPSLVKYDENCLFKTIQQRQYIRDFLFEYVYEYFKRNLHATKDGYTLLDYIGLLGPSENLINKLLPDFNAIADISDQQKKTLLFYTVKRNLTDTCEFLLDIGADPNARCSSGETPMYIAAQQGHTEIIRLLAKRGATQSINQLPFTGGISPLHAASENGHEDAVALLIELGAIVDANDDDGSTPLYVACKKGHKKIAHQLLLAEAKVDAPFMGGYTPLYICAQNGFTDIATLLTQRGADVNKVSPNSSTALYVACQNGHDVVVDNLIKAGASVDIYYSNWYSPLYVATQKGHLPVIKILLPVIKDINHQTNRGATAIYVASQCGHEDIVNFLLENNADPAVQFQNGYTALHIACGEGHVNIAKMLVNARPDLLNIKDNNGKTPEDILYLSWHTKHMELIEYFKEVAIDIPGKFKRERENDEIDSDVISEPKKAFR